MPSISQFYLEHMASKTGYRATWEPNCPLYLGAIVTLEQGIFAIQSDLKKEGIIMQELLDTSDGMLDYTSEQSVKIGTKLAGQMPIAGSVLSAADAGFSIDFSSERAIVFQAEKTRTHQISNLAEIEQEVVQRVNGNARKWHKDWLIVTQLMVAETATIIVSYSRNSKIELKASADVGVGQFKLTNSTLGLSVANEQGSHLKVLAQQGISPLYRVMGYRHPLFGRESLGTKNVVMAATKRHQEQEQFQVQPFDSAELMK